MPGDIPVNEQGRRVDAVPVIMQWQGGTPYTVYPVEGAAKQSIWPQ